jgi:4'-phosphopantetheinyl transferase EntD
VTLIGRILPNSVATAEAFGATENSELFDEELDAVGRAGNKRYQEFAAGRTCARRALSQLGFSPVPILPGPNREPLWPRGIVGSITHCDSYVAAAIARESRLVTLGIDAEENLPLPSGMIDLVSSHECDLSRGQDECGVCWDRLLFSAKESVFKAWFPLFRTWLEFKDVLVRIAPEPHSFMAVVLHDHKEEITFSGRYAAFGTLLLTAVILECQPHRDK